MSALNSSLGGHAMIRWWDYLLAYFAGWLIPPVLSGLALPYAGAILGGATRQGVLTFLLFGREAVYLSWIGLAISVPVVLTALSRGRFGWGFALVAGLAIGAALGTAVEDPGPTLTAPFAGVSALIIWTVLRLRAPAAFRG